MDKRKCLLQHIHEGRSSDAALYRKVGTCDLVTQCITSTRCIDRKKTRNPLSKAATVQAFLMKEAEPLGIKARACLDPDTKLRTEMQSSSDCCYAPQVQPTDAIRHPAPSPKASSRRGLAAERRVR